MYVDKQLLLSDAQTVCNSASELSENIIDLGAAMQVARGKAMYVVIIIDTAFSTCTSIDFQLWTDDTTTVSSGAMMCSTGAIAVASLTANRAPIVLPVGDAINYAQQYIGLYYVLAGSADSGNAVTAFLAFDAP
jgi:hypothetical protein